MRIAKTNNKQTPWISMAQECLKKTKEALARYAADEGWACLLEAERLEVEGLSRNELATLLVSLRKETHEKLKDWRQEATKELLSANLDANGDAASQADVARIQAALLLRNDHFHNLYLRIRIQKRQLTLAGLFVAVALLIFLVIANWIWSPAILTGAEGTLVQLAALFGLLGGALSTAISLARRGPRGRIPEHLSSWGVTLVRPVLGAAAAVAAYVFLKADAVPFATLSGEWAFLGVSFLAGFSEQWFMQVVATAGKKSE